MTILDKADPANPPSAQASSSVPGVRTGSWRVVGILVVGVLVCAVLSLMIGNVGISPTTSVRALFAPDNSQAAAIIQQLRLPRTALLIVVGLALGLSGALMQGQSRNPLADPGLLGISEGASLAVVLAIFWLHISSPVAYGWFALLGAGLTAWLVFSISALRGGPSPLTLVLTGAAVSALASAIITSIITSNVSTLDQYRFWVVGSAAGRGLDVFWQVLPFLALGVVLTVVCTPAINLLQLGDDAARALGVRPGLHKFLGICAVMLLTGGAVAACGPIGFLGLVAPHVARLVCGPDYRWVVPYSGLIGAIVLTLADILGRVIAGGAEVQVGIVMALVGGPVFVLLVRRARLVQL
ncbi:FecCD family ABC transporter permease [Flexivirga caeni]|uniref:Iron ABC transporter permease n=1 Tax=Flexivirga caeni TaxID=2294115 RepID=A0A3M9M418_9MICO|nr:iron ABC transporter permease [Flexivirga caeni]RNI20319.1 iron ABC transporter permease [Flexivirga caeni]